MELAESPDWTTSRNGAIGQYVHQEPGWSVDLVDPAPRSCRRYLRSGRSERNHARNKATGRCQAPKRRCWTRGPALMAAAGAPDTPSDEALIAGMVLGDELAAVAFVRRYQKRVFGLALGMLGDPGVAEDVAQEALIRAWRHAPVFDVRRGTATAWVLTITRNLAIDAIRKHRALPTDPNDLIALGMASTGRSPEDLGSGTRLAPELRAALNALPVTQRRAVVLAALYGRTIDEISLSESIPQGTAKTRVRAGLRKLRAALHNAEEWR
jgi:RNA polymerase sigma factor (sigma-70 family)